MPKVSATVFKARCLELMDRVAERREAYVVTKRGKAVARLVPVARQSTDPLFGRLSDLVQEIGDITQPVVPPASWTTTKRGAKRRRK